jgi:hypothetical protein
MVFSTVQISMPGTSWAGAVAGVSRQAAIATGTARAIRPIIKNPPGQFVASRVSVTEDYHTETSFAR